MPMRSFVPTEVEKIRRLDDDCDDDVNYGYFDDIMNSDQEFSK